MPSPNTGEKRSDFILRCMADTETNRTYPDQRQRFAFCASQWVNRNKEIKMSDEITIYKTGYIQKGSIDKEERTIVGYASTTMVDRHNEVILSKSWNFENYQKHPIVFINHISNNNNDLWVGRTLWLKQDNKGILFKMRFADSEKGNQLFDLIMDTEIAAFSVGARSWGRKEMTFGELPKSIKNKSREMGDETPITVHTNVELLEISVVGLPSNADSTVTNEMVIYNNLVKDIGGIEVEELKLEDVEALDMSDTDGDTIYMNGNSTDDMFTELKKEMESLKEQLSNTVIIKLNELGQEEVTLEDDELEITDEDINNAIENALGNIKINPVNVDVKELIENNIKRLMGKID